LQETKEQYNSKDFLLKEIPYFNPVSQSHKRASWWKEQKRRSIEGFWHSGKWMPGLLYFYVNFCKIEMSHDKSKKMVAPWLRDLEWDKAFVKAEAMGFSGFEDDQDFSCNHLLKGDLSDDELKKYHTIDQDTQKINTRSYNNLFNKKGERKAYVNPRVYLRKLHNENKGRAVWLNHAHNLIDLESRDGGKSFNAAGEITHDFLFDGALYYDEYLEGKKEGKAGVTQILVGSINATYGNALLKKFKDMLALMPGKVLYNGVEYPSPFSVSTSGSLRSGMRFVNEDSGSQVIHVTFKDNPGVAAGLRCSKVFLEEVGYMNNIKDVLAGLKDVVSASGEQYGVIHMFGTGGLSKGLAAIHTMDIMFDPLAYNCLGFPDKWENRDSPIGYFVPGTMVLNQFKEGFNLETNFKRAEDWVTEYRKEVEKNKELYAGRIINRPLVPSEIFYNQDSNFFPTIDLKMQKGDIESDPKRYEYAHWRGFCRVRADNVEFQITGDEPIRKYPYKSTAAHQGCVEIFEHPVEIMGEVPGGIYIAGCDPVDDDGFEGSLQSAFIMHRLTRRIVAEYTARHATVAEYYENLRKLLIYYNAKCNYESNKKGLFAYFQNKRSLHLLCETPKILHDKNMLKTQSALNKSYGTLASKEVNKFGRDLLKTYLLDNSYKNPEVNNVFTIRSLGMVLELLFWNPEANFDRVSALGMLMILLSDQEMMSTESVVNKVSASADAFWDRPFKGKSHNNMHKLLNIPPRIQ